MMESIPVAPTRPPAPYIGGKRNLSAAIIARLQTIPHRLYAEPFVGMGGVFLRRPWRSRAEVINDVSVDVANLFRMLQRHYEALLDMMRWQLTTRADFDRLQETPAEALTDLERAARFLYLQRAAYGGKVVGQSFGISRSGPARFDVTKLAPLLADVHERLAGVVIERLAYGEFIRRYDAAETLFYLDPPYVGSEGDYGRTFDPGEFERLAALLRQVRGRWLLSINDVPEARRLFGWAEIEAVAVTYRIGGRPTRAGELIIAGGCGSGVDLKGG